MRKVRLSRLRLLRPSDRAGRVPETAPAKPSKLEPQAFRPKLPKPPQLPTR